MPDHLGRRDHGAVDDVVGDVQHAAHEDLVHVVGPLAALVAVGHALLEEEAALGALGHDEHVLDHLGVDEVEHLAPEVRAVGPADAAAGDRAAAQVQALDDPVMDVDLDHQARLGQVPDAGVVELEADVPVDPVLAIEVGAQGAVDQVEQGPEDDVLVVIVDPAELVLAALGEGGVGRGAVAAGGGIEAGLEELPQAVDHRRLGQEDLLVAGEGVAQADLSGVAEVGPHHVDALPGDRGAQADPVQQVVVDPLREDRLDAVHQHLGAGDELFVPEPPGALQPEGVQRHVLTVGQPDVVGVLIDHDQAVVVEHRQHVGEQDVGVLEDAQVGAPLGIEEDAGGDGASAGDAVQELDVAQGLLHRGHPAVLGVEGLSPAEDQLGGPRGALGLHDVPVQAVDPGGGDGDQRLDRVVDVALFEAAPAGHVEVHQHGVEATHEDAVVAVGGARGLDQDLLQALAHLLAPPSLGHGDQGEGAGAVGALDQVGPRVLLLLGLHHAIDDRADLGLGRSEEELGGQGVEDVGHALVGVAAGLGVLLGEDAGQGAPQPGDVPAGLGDRPVGEEALDDDGLARRALYRGDLDADLVHPPGAVHPGLELALAHRHDRAVEPALLGAGAIPERVVLRAQHAHVLVVDGEAHEDEVVGDQPLQEVAGLAEIGGELGRALGHGEEGLGLGVEQVQAGLVVGVEGLTEEQAARQDRDGALDRGGVRDLGDQPGDALQLVPRAIDRADAAILGPAHGDHQVEASQVLPAFSPQHQVDRVHHEGLVGHDRPQAEDVAVQPVLHAGGRALVGEGPLEGRSEQIDTLGLGVAREEGRPEVDHAGVDEGLEELGGDARRGDAAGRFLLQTFDLGEERHGDHSGRGREALTARAPP